jgi:hypothetical protein
MARPRVRTAELSEESRTLYRRIFGRSTTAYQNLLAGHEREVSYWTFQRAWTGEKVTPETVQSIERGWKRWTEATWPERQQWMGALEDASRPSEESEPRHSPPEGVERAG